MKAKRMGELDPRVEPSPYSALGMFVHQRPMGSPVSPTHRQLVSDAYANRSQGKVALTQSKGFNLLSMSLLSVWSYATSQPMLVTHPEGRGRMLRGKHVRLIPHPRRGIARGKRACCFGTHANFPREALANMRMKKRDMCATHATSVRLTTHHRRRKLPITNQTFPIAVVLAHGWSHGSRARSRNM